MYKFATILLILFYMVQLSPSNYIQLLICLIFIVLGIFFIFWRFPKYDKALKTVKQSLVSFGTLLLVWALYYLIYQLYNKEIESNIIIRASLNVARYYFIAIMLKEIIITLLALKRPIIKNIMKSLIVWGIFSLALWINVVFVPEQFQWPFLLLGLVWFVFFIVFAVREFTESYDKSLKDSENFFSYDVEGYIKWIKKSVHALSILGITAGIHTLFPDYYPIVYLLVVTIYFVLMSLYMFKFVVIVSDHVDDIHINDEIEGVTTDESVKDKDISEILANPIYKSIESALNHWIEMHNFIDPELTIVKLAKELDTNRTYLSTYINEKFGVTFREWVSKLRLDYSKQLLLEHPDLPANKIGMMVGYSANRYVVVFTQVHGMSPGQWRKQNFVAK